MRTTAILTRKLREEDPHWTLCTLANGRNNPLVKSGVLVCGEMLTYIECKCSDCDHLPKPYIRNEGEDVPRWAYTCQMTGETIDVDEDYVHDWRYDADRFAAIVCERLECENVQKVNNNTWSLGYSQIPETQGRAIVIMTRFRKCEAESISKLVDGQSFLLLVGSKEYEVEDDQFRRRIFTFDQVIRFREDGTMDFVLAEIENRLRERVNAKERKERTDKVLTEKRIAEFLKSRFFSIIRIQTWKEREKIIKELNNVSAIGEALVPKIKKSTMNGYLKPKLKPKVNDSCPQFWFNVVRNPDYFLLCEQIVKEKNYIAENYGAFEYRI